jgi:serine/threonine protein kinase/formylglycine-generating enzyme required for sulfatase activity
MEPACIGRYEIHIALGQGGMGTVYKARDPLMDRWIALKTITVQDASQRARFRQEVQAAGKLNHPHITTIYDVGEAGDLAYIVMELVEGDTLAGRLSAPVPWSEAISLLLPICQALAYAHSQGVIHRDVKPANILISTGGQVKLTDFGVARLEAALRRITESGSTVGTPLYTAPEQIRNEMVDGRADLFSLGIVLYELITTQHPFIGENLAQVVYRITQAEPANLEPLVGTVPPAVVEVVARALSKDREARFANAQEMAQALTVCLQQRDFVPTPSAPDLRRDLSARPFTSSSDSSAGLPILDVVASNLTLSPTEEALLRGAFTGHDRIFLEREFSSGYSGSRVLLATPVRSGRRLAQVVLKLGSAAAVEREWQAYQEFVKDTLPPVTARIMEEPLRAKEGSLALLQYNFAGGLGQIPPESLRTYYARNSGEEVATLLEKGVFRAFGSKWWLQRRATDLIFRREYDRLLPVHLVVERRDFAEATATPRLLVAGKIGSHAFRQLDAGQLVQLQGFTVEEVQAAQGEVTLQGLPPSGSSTNPIRVRVMGLPPHSIGYQVGQRVPALIGVVMATRHDLLRQAAQSAFPDQDLSQKQMTIGGQLYPNPLYDYDALLDQHVSAMTSIIHGDLNLDNILVTPTSRLAWLIDFATTRDKGHNLYDFMRLETQVITKPLPQTRLGPEAATRLMQALHQAEAAPHQLPPELQKPFTVLTAIRRMVKVCMYNRENWDEYYLGLTLMLLGSLKFKELDASARGMALAAAATLRGLITMPALRVTPPPILTPLSQPSPARPKIAILAVGVVFLLVIVIGLALWALGLLPSANPPPPTATAVVAVASPTPTPTWTPTVTSFPSPTVSVEGVVFGSAEIRSGPGEAYPALGSVPVGNRVHVTGRSADGAWLQFEHPGGPGGYGWLPVALMTLVEAVTPPVVTANPPPPSPTSTPTAVPVAVVTPTSTPCASPTYYADLPAKYPNLGCAIESWQSDFTFQQFEHGLMIWRKTPAPAQIYILYENSTWHGQEDPQGSAQPACWEAEQTDGLGPIFSFGEIWCAGEKDRLGLPLTKEIASEDSPIEQFEGGLAFTLSRSGYVLLEDGRWTSLLDNGRFLADGAASEQRYEDHNNGNTSPSFPDLEWIAIPGGSFVMGSSEADIRDAVADCNAYEGNCQTDWFSAEAPQRLETMGDFEITRYEITNAQYNLCVKNGSCSPPRKVSSDNSVAYSPSFFTDDYPVVTVTTADAATFCQWVGSRLPSEKEWEKAARGSDGRRYPWGNMLDVTRANLYSSGPTKVGSYLNGASPYGVMDMAGNVAEFTRDNVVRGGSWKSYPHYGRTTNRSTGSWLTQDFVNFDIGFRCVR